MNNIIKRKWNQNSMVIIEDLQGMAFQAESGGHTFQISGIDGEGNAVALSGTPAGVMLRSDGQDVTLTCSVSGGVVFATLPANAYSVPGRFGLTIFLTSDGQKTAIYAAVGTVGKTSSGTVAPPAGSDVVDLVNQINTAIAAIPANYNACFAPAYSTSGLYSVGQYVMYNGSLYRCTTAITSGESWTAAHWTQTNMGDETYALKSAIGDMQESTDNIFYLTNPHYSGNGITVDLQPDGTYLFNGTATGNISLGVMGQVNGNSPSAVFPAGIYSFGWQKVSGSVTEGNQNDFSVRAEGTSSTYTVVRDNKASSTKTFTSDAICILYIKSGTVLTKYKVKLWVVSGSTLGDFIPNKIVYDFIARKNIGILDSEVEEIQQTIGSELPILTPCDYATVTKKVFATGTTYTKISDAINDASTDAWRYGYCDIEEGETYRVTFYADEDFDRIRVMFGDDSDNLIQIAYKGVLHELKTVDVTAPAGSTKIYVCSYTSATQQGRNLVILHADFKDVYSYLDYLNNEVRGKAEETDIVKMFSEESSWDGIIVDQRLVPSTGGLSNSTIGKRTNLFLIDCPTMISVADGYLCYGWKYNNPCRVNTGTAVAAINSGEKSRCLFVTEYPIWVVIGIMRTDGTSISSDDKTEIANSFKIKTMKHIPFTDISMFTKFGVTGCSWDAGTVYDGGTPDTKVSKTGLGWGENLARQHGIECVNFALGGTGIKDFYNTESAGCGLKAILSADALPFYWLVLGNSNDTADIGNNLYTVGSLADITGYEDYHDYPTTYYGMYGKIIEQIMEHAPKCKIIITSPDTLISENTIFVAMRTANAEIAEHYGIPYVDLLQDPYYFVYAKKVVANHPTAATYAGAAKMMERLFEKAVKENFEYFDDYIGTIQTVPVTWEPLT